MKLAVLIRLLSGGGSPDAAALVMARGLRAFGDGLVVVLLPFHLAAMGMSVFQIGTITTATLLGSGALTLTVGFTAHRWRTRSLLMSAAVLMVVTGVSFALVRDYWLLILVAFLGTINPSTGDVSVFLPLEQSAIAQAVSARTRTAAYARYRFLGSVLAAFGSLAAAAPTLVPPTFMNSDQAVAGMFMLYALLGVGCLVLYRRLGAAIEISATRQRTPLGPSRSIVLKIAGLFTLDAFGGAFVFQSLIVLWLYLRFSLSVGQAGTIFFALGILSSLSQLAAPALARRFGLVKMMVFTHLPANIALMMAAFMPSLPLALTFLSIRSTLSTLEIPARTSYVMAVVTPAERAAAATVTAVPRSIAAALGPLLSTYLLGLTTFGWPLIVGGLVKAGYDVGLLAILSPVKPPEESITATENAKSSELTRTV